MIVQKARQSVDRWIGICTVGGITLLVCYTWVLIPTVTRDIIFWTLFCCAWPTGAMIAYHKVLMNRRWDAAAAFLGEQESKGAEVEARQALEAVLDFPVKMPLFGLLAWAVGGLGAIFGALASTSFMLQPGDAITLYIGIISGALIITIFQFYQWRHLVDPVAEEIMRRAPEVLEGDLPAMRTPLKQSRLFTLIPLIVLALFMAEMAGYRQASTTLQNWVGQSHLDDLKAEVEKIGTANLSDPAVQAEIVARLKVMPSETFHVYLIEPRKDGDWDLVQNRATKELFPGVVMAQTRKTAEAAQDHRSFLYNPFIPEIYVFQRFEAGTGPEAKEYYLMFGYPWSNYSSQLNYFIVISIFLMLGVVLVSGGVVLVLARDVSEPVARLVKFTDEVARGHIHSDVTIHANDEVGDLAMSFRRMSSQLQEVLQRIHGAVGSLDQATGSIRQASESVKEGAKAQEQTIEDVASAMSEMDVNIQGIADNVEVLSSSAEESSSSIFEMGAAIKKINESVDVLNVSINEVSSSINEMTAALDQVADNVTNLSAVTEETASSMAQMDASIREIESNAKDTADWSESVIADSEAGVDAVSQVTRGMHDIAEVVHSAQLVIERLGARVMEIGKIVQVIDDVANQTNLLALNAAIIAAQAGEHGRGFAVVADEIKQLAERTSGSTREIHQLIRGVQEESRQAVGAVSDGARAVEEGVALTDQASQSLAKIMDSARLATERVQGIARTTVEQGESSRQVSQAIDRVAEMVSQISVATQEQAKGGALILKATDEMKTASLQVKRNAEEQLQGSKLITKSVENITDMLYSINQAQQEQKRSSGQVIQLMERIKVVSQKNAESVGRLTEVLATLSREADALREEMKRFEYGNREHGPGKSGL